MREWGKEGEWIAKALAAEQMLGGGGLRAIWNSTEPSNRIKRKEKEDKKNSQGRNKNKQTNRTQSQKRKKERGARAWLKTV